MRALIVTGAGLCLLVAACTGPDPTGSARPVSTTSAPDPTVSTTTTPTTPTSTTTTTTTTVLSPVTTEAPLRVTVIGDSVTFDAEPAIVALLESTATATVATTSIGGIGFSRFPDVRDHLRRRILEMTEPDMVVIMVGGWDFSTAYADPEGYDETLDTVVTTLAEAGVGIVWLAMPPTPPGEGNELPRLVINETYRSLAGRWPDDVTYVDTTTVLGGPDGSYQRFLPGADGIPEQVRKVRDGRDDGHLCPAGARRIAQSVFAALTAQWDLAEPAPGWETEAWTGDARYDDPPGGCAASS